MQVIFIVNGNLAFVNSSLMLNWLNSEFPGWAWLGFSSTANALTYFINNPGIGPRECFLLPGRVKGTLASYQLITEFMPNHNLARIDA